MPIPMKIQRTPRAKGDRLGARWSLFASMQWVQLTANVRKILGGIMSDYIYNIEELFETFSTPNERYCAAMECWDYVKTSNGWMIYDAPAGDRLFIPVPFVTLSYEETFHGWPVTCPITGQITYITEESCYWKIPLSSCSWEGFLFAQSAQPVLFLRARSWYS